MKFKIKGDPRPFTTNDYETLLHYLNATSQIRSKTVDEFMADYAERILKFRNITMKSSNMEGFVEELISIGELERIE